MKELQLVSLEVLPPLLENNGPLSDSKNKYDERLYNSDLAPVPDSERNWGTYNFAALWISMAHCVPTYMLAGGLVAMGMNWW